MVLQYGPAREGTGSRRQEHDEAKAVDASRRRLVEDFSGERVVVEVPLKCVAIELVDAAAAPTALAQADYVAKVALIGGVVDAMRRRGHGRAGP